MTDISTLVADVVIRVAADGEGDIEAIARLRREWADEQGGPRAGIAAPEPQVAMDGGLEPRFADWYLAESGRRVTWLAELDGRPVGMVSLVVFSRMPRPDAPEGGWGYLSNAFVLAAYRNRGVGGRLLAGLLEYASDQHLARVVLSPSERSVPFYQRAGFGPADMLLAKVLAG